MEINGTCSGWQEFINGRLFLNNNGILFTSITAILRVNDLQNKRLKITNSTCSDVNAVGELINNLQ
jgi:hypothetical protein